MHIRAVRALRLAILIVASVLSAGFGAAGSLALATGAAPAARMVPPSVHATGFYRVQKINSIWWIISPNGKPCVVRGVDSFAWMSPRWPWGKPKPGGYANPLPTQVRRVVSWGFNCAGAWSNPASVCSVGVPSGNSLAVAPVLEIAESYLAQLKQCPASVRANVIPDVFNPGFARFAKKFCRRRCAKWKNNPRILGWYSDSEQGWKADWRSKPNETLLIRFLNFPMAWPGHLAAVRFVIQRYGSIRSLDRIWHAHYRSWSQFAATKVVGPFMPPVSPYIFNPVMERRKEAKNPNLRRYLVDCRIFAGLVASRYFRICRDAIRDADPNHMYLGAKFTYYPGTTVMDAIGRYAQVISVDDYGRNAIPSLLPYASLGRPVLIGEFSFRAKDSGLPNTVGTGPLVRTQSQRVQGMIRYVRQALSIPEVIGYCWFEYFDESAHGAAWSRENSNYGLVRRNGVPYRKLTAAFKNLNALADGLHAAARAVPIPHSGFNTN